MRAPAEMIGHILGGLATRAILIALAALAIAPSSAFAHAELLRSIPSDGSVVTTAPATLELVFTEPIVVRYAVVKVLDASGRLIASTGSGGAPLVPTLRGATLTTALPKLADGTYKVLWRSVSADDFHPVGDQFIFAVGANAKAPAAVHPKQPSEPRPRLLEALARWAVFAAFSLLAGLFALASLASPLVPRVRRPLPAAFAGAATACLLLLLVQVSSVAYTLDNARRVLFDTGFGEGLLVQGALLLLGLDGLLGRRYRLSTGLLVLAAAAGAIGSHASGIGAAAEVVLAVHLGAAALWFGLVAAAALTVLPALRSPGDEREVALAALRRLGWVAGPAAGFAVAAGVYSAGTHVATPDALVTTIYGGTLIAKTALVGAAGGLALLANRALRASDRGAGRIRRALPVEATVLVLVLLGGAVMASAAPARGPRFLARPLPPASVIVTVPADDLVITLQAKPNVPGPTFVAVNVIQTRRPPPGEVTAVAVSVAGPGANPAERAASNVSETEWDVGDLELGAAGSSYRFTIRVERQNVAPLTATATWTVGGATAAPVETTISRARLSPATTVASALIALTTALGLLVALRRRVVPT